MIVIEIPGEIVAKGRPRFTRVGHAYTPAKTRQFEKVVGMYTRQTIKKTLEGALEVYITVQKRPPKSWSKKKRKAALEGKIHPAVRPDIDNYGKSILDGMDGIAFKDDNQICSLNMKKIYAEKAGAIVSIEELKGEGT